MTTYKQAGVDIEAGDNFAAMIKELVKKNWPETAKEIGGFAGGGPIPSGAVQVKGSTDGTGTVAILSALAENFQGIGQNAVAMGAVDMYVSGARPLYLLDTLNVGSLEPEKHIKIIESVIGGCKLAGCKLIGGETAELPDMFKYPWMFNLDVAVIGFPDPDLDFVPVREGQLVYGWASGGPGSNGFSLLRRVHKLRVPEDGNPFKVREKLCESRFGPDGVRSLADTLLCPAPIHIRKMDDERKRGVVFAGHAHITGGGMVGNIPRILPRNLAVVIDKSLIPRPAIFRYTQEVGKIAEDEMDRVFSQGVMVASFVDQGGRLPKMGRVIQIGQVVKRKRNEPQVQFTGKYYRE